MSVIYCHSNDEYIDLDYNAEHIEECMDCHNTNCIEDNCTTCKEFDQSDTTEQTIDTN